MKNVTVITGADTPAGMSYADDANSGMVRTSAGTSLYITRAGVDGFAVAAHSLINDDCLTRGVSKLSAVIGSPGSVTVIGDAPSV